MSCSESDTTQVDEESSKKDADFQILEISRITELDQPKVFDYIEKLHKLIKKKEKSLKKYKEKVKKLLKQVKQLKTTASSPKITESNELTSLEKEPTTVTTVSIEETTTTASFVDEIRQAAEQAQSLSDFVYEPTSGLYYDQKTGYYYNAEYGLYYDGHTGCYYNYNQEKNTFEFHSQVEVQPNQNAVKDENDANNRTDIDKDADLMEDVQFDEHGGVITDREKLRKLRKEKRKRERELKRAKQKTKKNKPRSKKSRKDLKKEKKSKQKRARQHDSSDSDDEEYKRNKSEKVDIEDGELSESSSDSSSNSSSNESEADNDVIEVQEVIGVPIFKGGGRFQDIAKKYPPSLRIIVQETNVESLKVGSLSLITYKGGSLGREGNHDVIIPDVNVSKSHLEFIYDRKGGVYKCIDLGSRNGTILNGTPMSVAKEAYDLVHGSVLQIGQTKLLCHTHEGNSTCGLCEPGLLIEAQSEKDAVASSVHLSHKEELKRLQKRYGLENEKFVEGNQTSANSNYKDRAATRRIKVGSSSDKEKTQIASVSTAISSENKGFKMLSKLGWSEGEALGKTQAKDGLLEPINVLANEGKKGLGCEELATPTLTKSEKKKLEAYKKMQERYEKTTDIFTLSDDNSN